MRVRLGASSWNVTAPSTWPFSPFDFQMMRSLGTISMIFPSQVRCDQKIWALKVTFASSWSWSALSTFFMKPEKSPNWVHWL